MELKGNNVARSMAERMVNMMVQHVFIQPHIFYKFYTCDILGCVLVQSTCRVIADEDD